MRRLGEILAARGMTGDVDTLTREHVKSADDNRALHMYRLERMFMCVYPRADKGDPKAVDTAVLGEIGTKAAEFYALDPSIVLAESERIIKELGK